MFQLLAVYTAIFSSLLILDYFLDGREVSYSVNDKVVTIDPFSKIVSIEGERFVVDNYEFWLAEGKMPIRMNHSYLFDDMKSISIMTSPLPPYRPDSHSDKRMRKYTNFENAELFTTICYYSVYGVFPVLHLMLFVPLVLVMFKRPTLRFNIWRLVSLWIIFPVITYFTFSNDRIFNLIDLIMES